MKALIFLILSLFSASETSHAPQNSSEDIVIHQQQEKMTIYYFIRHAEKDESDPSNKDPELTAAGKIRAAKWAEILQEVELDAIYSTDYNRTRETAAAIAASQDKTVTIYDPRKLNDPDFQKETKGKTTLVVGHSNTTPAFVNAILGEKKYVDIDEKESGALFIVQIAPNGTNSSQVLYIN